MLLLGGSASAQQVPDPDFDPSVERPAYTQDGPTVVIDEAHNNTSRMAGRYKPFADVLKNDGYSVVVGEKAFNREDLRDVDVLVVANALPPDGAGSDSPGLTDQESDVVRDWVRAGGALLLIADHTPYGSAMEDFSLRFGVTMGKGWVWDLRETGDSITTQLVSSPENGLLGVHPLLRRRGASEEVTILRSFFRSVAWCPARGNGVNDAERERSRGAD